MSWGAVRRQTNTLPTLRPHYSLLQAEVNAAQIAILLARFLTTVRSCTRMLPTQCLKQDLPQFRFTAATVGVYLIITPVLLFRMEFSALARFHTKICVTATKHQLIPCPERNPLARVVSKRKRPILDLLLLIPNFNKNRKTLQTCETKYL